MTKTLPLFLTVCSFLKTAQHSWVMQEKGGWEDGHLSKLYISVCLSFSFFAPLLNRHKARGHSRERGLSWSLFRAVGERFRVEPHWEWQWRIGCILSWEAQKMTYDNKGYCRVKEELEMLVWILMPLNISQHNDRHVDTYTTVLNWR